MSFPYDRRKFIKSMALLPLAAAAGVPLEVAAEGLPPLAPIKRVGGSNFKISINAYSFTGPLPQTHEDQTVGASAPIPAPSKTTPKKEKKKGTHKGGPKMTLFDLVDFCSKNNIDGCDPTGYFFPTYPTPPPTPISMRSSGTPSRRALASAGRASGTISPRRTKRSGITVCKKSKIGSRSPPNSAHRFCGYFATLN